MGKVHLLIHQMRLQLDTLEDLLVDEEQKNVKLRAEKFILTEKLKLKGVLEP